MINVICVLSKETHGGSVYGAHDVNVLAAQVARHLKQPHRFVCLTNHPDGIAPTVECQPLTEGWPGWWAKIEVFKPGRFLGRNLFLDLDTVIVDDITPLVETKGTIKDWHTETFGSACVTWDGDDLRATYDLFTPAVLTATDCEGRQLFIGDQDWMHTVTRPPSPLLQSAFPFYPEGWCQTQRRCVDGPTPGALIVCFHGNPKPSAKPYAWVEKHWRL